MLHWTTPCDGGGDITGHEYREKVGNGSFGSWIPISNSAGGEANAASYTVTGLNNPSDYTFEVRAVNELGEGEISSEAVVSNLPAVPLSDRTPEVRDGIVAAVPGVSDYRIVTEVHLAAITGLFLGLQNITALKAGDFSGLTALTRLNLQGNQLSSLPDGVFEGLTALTQLRLGGNAINPLPLTVSLVKVGADQFKAVVPAGAPFEMVLPLTVTDGSINGGATTITIPAGSVESETFTVIRTPGTSDPVTVDLGTLPGLPADHFGYALVKSADLPLQYVIEAVSYDNDGDGLIEIGSLAQLNAIRWDLDGDGAVDDAENATAYGHAFPNAVPGMGCPTTTEDVDDNDCAGYELTVSLDFDTDGDGDVDGSDSYWNGGLGWEPIGNASAGFVATFVGNDYTISHLYIARSSSRIGLFGAVGNGGRVKNVGVRYGTVSGSSDWSSVGGLVGYNYGSIVASYATGTVSGSGATRQSVGGLVGYNSSDGSVVASYATGKVSGSSDWSGVGGLVGYNSSDASVVASYATGTVKGSGATRQSVGGLVGYNSSDASVVASYATGKVSGSSDWSGIGGLVGYNSSDASVVASYATGTVSGSGARVQNVGGLAGYNGTAGNISNCYWNTETSGLATGAGGAGKTTEELQTPTGYSGIYANWNRDLDGDNTADDPWDFGTRSDYPALRADLNGDGTASWQEFGEQRPGFIPPPAATTDFNGDGRTDFADFFLFADAYGGTEARFDLDGSGTVDFADFFKFIDAFGT